MSARRGVVMSDGASSWTAGSPRPERPGLALDVEELVGVGMQPGPDRPVGPLDADLGARRGAEPAMHPAGLPAVVATADGQLATHRGVPDAHLDPCADRIAVRPGLGRAHGQPVAELGRRRRVARADAPPDLDRGTEVDLDEVEQSVEVEVGQRRAATEVEADDAGGIGALDGRSVGLAEEEVARVLLGEIELLADIALRDEQVDVAVVVDVLELRVPG